MDAFQAYRESGITDDDPVHLIVLLHDSSCGLATARSTLFRNKIYTASHQRNGPCPCSCSAVARHAQSGSGGEVARNSTLLQPSA